MSENNKIDDVMNGKYYSVKEVSKILGVSTHTIFKWFNMGVLSHFNLSERRTIVTDTELKRFLKDHENILSKRRKIN